jgi:hypothetical protein
MKYTSGIKTRIAKSVMIIGRKNRDREGCSINEGMSSESTSEKSLNFSSSHRVVRAESCDDSIWLLAVGNAAIGKSDVNQMALI